MGHGCQTARLGGARWATTCTCGWESPIVYDRRTANQAHREHARQTNGGN